MDTALAPSPAPAQVTPPVDGQHDVAVEKEKAVVPPVPTEDKSLKTDQESTGLALVQNTPDIVEKKSSKGSIDRDIALADVEKEKRWSYIKAWEESEKTKAENKAQKKLSNVSAWENSKNASLEAKLRKREEELERKKAVYAEKMKNKMALIHKEAEEKKAIVEARRGVEILEAEEMSAKYRATGKTPKKLLGCF